MFPAASTNLTIATLVQNILNFINTLLPTMVGIALVLFLFGIVRYIANAGDGKVYRQGRQQILWGIVAMFVLVSVWGIIKLMQAALLP